MGPHLDRELTPTLRLRSPRLRLSVAAGAPYLPYPPHLPYLPYPPYLPYLTNGCSSGVRPPGTGVRAVLSIIARNV